MSPHETAQSVAWFVFWICMLIVFVLWRDYKKEKRDEALARKRKEPSSVRSKYKAEHLL